MKCLKRYALSCLIAMFVLSGIDSYRHPDNDMRLGSLFVMAAAWPVVFAIAFGGAVGEVAHEIKQGKLG